MSKINGKPFTQQVIESLSEELQVKLLGLVNGSNQTPAFRSLVNPNNYITGADKNDVKHIILETWNKTYTGYLVYNNTYCVLFAYSLNTQELNIVKINIENKTYNLVKETLSILELRVILGGSSGGVGGDVTVDEINSGSATAGKVIVANGEGGASWGDIPDNAVLIDFYDETSHDYNSALSSDDFNKLADASIIYDYTQANSGGPVYYVRTSDGMYMGGAYVFYRIASGNITEILQIAYSGRAITHYTYTPATFVDWS